MQSIDYSVPVSPERLRKFQDDLLDGWRLAVAKLPKPKAPTAHDSPLMFRLEDPQNPGLNLLLELPPGRKLAEYLLELGWTQPDIDTAIQKWSQGDDTPPSVPG